MSLRRGYCVAAGIAALLTSAGSIAEGDLTNWSAQESRRHIEQQAPRQAHVNAPMSHWRPFFLPNDNPDPAFSARQRDARQTADRTAADSRPARDVILVCG